MQWGMRIKAIIFYGLHWGKCVRFHNCQLMLLVAGTDGESADVDVGVPTRFLGRLFDDISMRLAYCAADVTIVPSKQESFGQMASESLACGTPVACFDTTGLKDIVDHEVNGMLAEPFDAGDLGRCISTVLQEMDKTTMRLAARDKAVREFAADRVVEQYLSVYRNVVR